MLFLSEEAYGTLDAPRGTCRLRTALLRHPSDRDMSRPRLEGSVERRFRGAEEERVQPSLVQPIPAWLVLVATSIQGVRGTRWR